MFPAALLQGAQHGSWMGWGTKRSDQAHWLRSNTCAGAESSRRPRSSLCAASPAPSCSLTTPGAAMALATGLNCLAAGQAARQGASLRQTVQQRGRLACAPPAQRRAAPPRRLQLQQRLVVAAAAQAATLADTAALPLMGEDGQPNVFPGQPGVYAIYSADGALQYVGLTRKINLSVATHAEALPELVQSIKFVVLPAGGKEELQEAWKAWVTEAVQESGTIPPGNAPGETKWQPKQRRAKAEIRLTPGKGLQDLTCSVEDLIDAVVKTNKVVAFVKGTRTQPACGFSYRVLTILNEIGADYEVVNVLDEVYNPGVREAIKTYSQWPTLPQLFVDGEFQGGADIVEEMNTSGELRKLLGKA